MGKQTRTVTIKDLKIGGGNPVSVQSMCATPTRDEKATLRQIKLLHRAGADIIRVAVDSKNDLESLKNLRRKTDARLSVDLQENYPLAEAVAPYVEKIRYNPGHLHHLNKSESVEKKVAWLADVARKHGCALRVGVNCGSVAPAFMERFAQDRTRAIVESALWHCELLERLEFRDFVVSLKDSDPRTVILINEEFTSRNSEAPVHLGVTEAGIPPDGVLKTRIAFEKLLAHGIGDTLRVSLTLPFDKKAEEVRVGRQILKDVAAGRFVNIPAGFGKGLNVISCPSCSRVQNTAFIDLARKIRRASGFAKNCPVTIAVMGCRVNGPGETDEADLGLWCGPSTVTLKKKTEVIGTFGYDSILEAYKKALRERVSGVKC